MFMTSSKTRPGRATITSLLPGDPKSSNSAVIETGDWFGLYSEKPSSGTYWVNRGLPIQIDFRFSDKERQKSVYLSLNGVVDGRSIKKGETLHYELLAYTYPVDVLDQGAPRFLRTQKYLRNPAGLNVLKGKRVDSLGILDFKAVENTARFQIPRPDWKTNLTVPVRINGLNPNWSAGVFQRSGYAQGIYGDGTNRYSPSGFDSSGRVYASVFPDLSTMADVEIGHPVVCDAKDLIIQVTQKYGTNGYDYYVAVNNPTDNPIEATLKKNIDLPDFDFPEQKVSIAAGGALTIK